MTTSAAAKSNDRTNAGAAEATTLELTRTFPTTCEELYRCFTVPERVKQWFGPKGVSCGQAILDARPDGAYRIAMESEDGEPHVVQGRFLELDEPRRIRMTWAWESQPELESLVTLRFDPEGEGARLTLTHERLASAEACQRHRGGWTSSLECLAELLA